MKIIYLLLTINFIIINHDIFTQLNQSKNEQYREFVNTKRYFSKLDYDTRRNGASILFSLHGLGLCFYAVAIMNQPRNFVGLIVTLMGATLMYFSQLEFNYFIDLMDKDENCKFVPTNKIFKIGDIIFTIVAIYYQIKLW